MGDLLQGLYGRVCFPGVFKALVGLIGKPQLPGYVCLALFPPELPEPEG
jgi:hypothetical protein